MGKAYYEEKRSGLASEQFAMAKDLDPNDPTAWFYDSILLQSENRPVEALQAQQKAIALNDNRGVYRSRQLLDKDEAARNTASARIYSDLSFEKMAINEGTKALENAPENFSAHRFMADINATQPQRSLAVESELLQSKLLQPLNTHTLRPQLSDLQLADGPARFSYNEFNSLFTHSGPSLLIDGFIAENSTWGEDVIVSYLHNRFSITLGQYHYESDGFRELDWLEKDTLTAFAQFDITPDTMIQVEYTDDDQKNGDLNQHFFTDLFSNPDFKAEAERQDIRLGIRHQLSPGSLILGNILHSDNTFDQEFGFINTLADDKLDNGELQWISTFNDIKTIIGGSATDFESIITGGGNITVEQEYNRFYLYAFVPIMQEVKLTIGATYTTFDETVNRAFNLPNGDVLSLPSEDKDEDQINPKLGITWDITPATTLRLSAFREARRFDDDLTLEPTQISGFNQIFNDFSSKVIVDSKRYGFAIDHKINLNLYTGFSVLSADRSSEANTATGEKRLFDSNRELAEGYLYYTPNKNISVKVDFDYENYSEPKEAFPPNILSLKTYRVPVGIKYYHSDKLSTEILATYYNQNGSYLLPDQTEITGQDNFWLFDSSITYNLPNRIGKITLGGKNIFNTSFNYEDRSNNTAFLSSKQDTNFYELSPERIIYGKFILHF
ncbi:MAG TPA: TonB-dependent receptor [Thiotrichales bacterium]|nr:TonB-dependent receptor [Thiotrichales bacterium]